MIINAGQIKTFQAAAKDNFSDRLVRHLQTFYPACPVRLPHLDATVAELPSGQLHALALGSIRRAWKLGLRSESSIASYCAMTFEIAPNFDEHDLTRDVMNDKRIEAGKRLNRLLDTLTEGDWKAIREEYDINAWQLN